MNIARLATCAAFLLVGCATSPASTRRGETELAAAIAGRVAGAPVHCITLQNVKSSRVIDSVAILYTTSNGTLYVNRPMSGASSLRINTVLITDTHSGQLCNLDTVRLRDTAAQAEIASVGLGDFVPYPRSDKR